jgi:hypothetical protein
VLPREARHSVARLTRELMSHERDTERNHGFNRGGRDDMETKGRRRQRRHLRQVATLLGLLHAKTRD